MLGLPNRKMELGFLKASLSNKFIGEGAYGTVFEGTLPERLRQ